MAAAPQFFDTSDDYKIRAMTANDVSEVVAIERASYTFPWTEGIFRDCLRVGYLCRVLVHEDEVIGYGILGLGAGEAHVLNICISEPYRCRGLGVHFLEYLMQYAADSGAREAFLEVRTSNTSAIRLYQSFGFEQVGVRRGYYQAANNTREDAAVFKLFLPTRISRQL